MLMAIKPTRTARVSGSMAPKSQIPRHGCGIPLTMSFFESAKRKVEYSCKQATVYLTGLTDGSQESRSSPNPAALLRFLIWISSRPNFFRTKAPSHLTAKTGFIVPVSPTISTDRRDFHWQRSSELNTHG
jgi:hypothetical protein